MRKFLTAVVLTLVAAGSATAQNQTYSAGSTGASDISFNAGIRFRGNYHINRSLVSADSFSVPEDENGYGAGIEIIGNHIGIGLYGFTAGQAEEFDSEETEVVVLGELNYFWPFERLRLAPYAGIHAALGTFTKAYFDEPYFPKIQDGISGLGYQIGLRFKPIPVIGLDAQWRRLSAYAHESQEGRLEKEQILIGVTIF